MEIELATSEMEEPNIHAADCETEAITTSGEADVSTEEAMPSTTERERPEPTVPPTLGGDDSEQSNQEGDSVWRGWLKKRPHKADCRGRNS